jgi:DnaJ-class molecular chaperone
LNDVKKKKNYDTYGEEEEVDIDMDDFFTQFDFETMMTMMMGDVIDINKLISLNQCLVVCLVPEDVVGV